MSLALDWYKDRCSKLEKELQRYKDLEEQGRLIERKQAILIGEGFICSECGGDYMDVADADAFCSNRMPSYCPWCGAKFVDEVMEND